MNSCIPPPSLFRIGDKVVVNGKPWAYGEAFMPKLGTVLTIDMVSWEQYPATRSEKSGYYYGTKEYNGWFFEADLLRAPDPIDILLEEVG